mmetsp:Transcript_43296/g.49781  ORF Transcript_43296/g.49781 Transcript_43296/m.49781 type:complete len:273 (+) Transcript_43296:91-909(+)
MSSKASAAASAAKTKATAKVAACYSKCEWLPQFISEMLGTLILTWLFAILNTTARSPQAVAALYYVLLVSVGQLSCGYYNPAIVLGDLVFKKIELKPGLRYILAQFIGGFLGALIAYFSREKGVFSYQPTSHAVGYDMGPPFGILLFAYGLLIMLFICARSEKNRFVEGEKGNFLVYAILVYGFLSSIMSLTGGMMNPAVDVPVNILGHASMDDYYSLTDSQKDAYSQSLWIYLLAPIVGVLVSFILHLIGFGGAMEAGAEAPKEQEEDTKA